MVKEPEEVSSFACTQDVMTVKSGTVIYRAFFIAIILFSSQMPASPEQELPQNVGAVCFGKINESSG
jgi:hypothetical protein